MADTLNSLDSRMGRSARRLRRKLGGKRGHLHLRDADLAKRPWAMTRGVASAGPSWRILFSMGDA